MNWNAENINKSVLVNGNQRRILSHTLLCIHLCHDVCRSKHLILNMNCVINFLNIWKDQQIHIIKYFKFLKKKDRQRKNYSNSLISNTFIKLGRKKYTLSFPPMKRQSKKSYTLLPLSLFYVEGSKIRESKYLKFDYEFKYSKFIKILK